MTFYEAQRCHAGDWAVVEDDGSAYGAIVKRGLSECEAKRLAMRLNTRARWQE